MALLLFVFPTLLAAQRPVAARDSVTRRDSIARLTAVTVVATPAERAQPVGATHVDAATIRLTPANSPYDLLRQAAGLEVHEQGQGPGFASDASLRGFSSDHATDLALWVDGVPINEPVNGHAEGYNDWAVLFPGGIQDIDVLRGPSSALFGNFALAGVVNVRTLERMRGSEVTLSGGSFGRMEGMALTGYDHGAEGGGVFGARYQRESGFRPNSGYDVMQGHARVTHDLKPGVTLDAGAELYGGHWNSPGFLSEDQFTRHEYDIVSNPSDGGYKRRAQERVSLRVLAGNVIWRTTAYATQGRWQLFLTIPPAGGRFEGSGSQTEEEDARAGVGATTAATWATPNGDITLGGETRWDRSRYDNFFSTTRTRDSAAAQLEGRQQSGALFAQSHTDVGDRLRLDLGVRYDLLATRSTPDSGAALSASQGLLSPKMGALIHLAAPVDAYANVSRGFRSANGVISDPTLALITAWAYETGLKVNLAAATASLAVFRTDVSNEQTFNPVTLATTNGGSSRRQGIELDWRARLTDRVSISGDWTLNDARYRSLTAAPGDSGQAEVLDGIRVFNTSKYVGAATVDVAPGAGSWRLRMGANFVGPYSPFDEPGVVLGGYGLMQLSASRSLGDITIQAGVRNVLDRAYPELVAGHIVAPGQPRSVFVSATARP